MSGKHSRIKLGLKILRGAQKLAEEAGNAGVPGVKAVGLALKAICEVCEKAQHHREEFKRILKQTDELIRLIDDRWNIAKAANQDKAIAELIAELEKPLIEAQQICTKYADKSYKKHVGLVILKNAKTSQALEDCETKIREALDKFMRDSQMLILRKLSDLENQTAAIHENTKGVPEHQEEQRNVNILLQDRVNALVQGMLQENKERLEPWIRKNISEAYELLEALDYKSPTPAQPEEESNQNDILEAILEADRTHKLINMRGRITKGKVKYETQFVGHEKGTSTSEAPLKKYWIERINHSLGQGGINDIKALTRIQEAVKMGIAADHENIIELIGYFIDTCQVVWNQWAFTVSEYYNYENLDQYLRSHADKSPLRLLKQLASGLSYLANKKPPIVNGDVRCRNVLVTDQGIVKLSQFSTAAIIAGLVEDDPTVQRTTIADDSSVWWQSSAILLKDGPITPATDVWAFAITMVECLSLFELTTRGRKVYDHPFPEIISKREFEIFLKKRVQSGVKSLEYEPKPSSEYATKWGTEAVWQIISHGLTLDPANRPAISELRDRLAEIVEEWDT